MGLGFLGKMFGSSEAGEKIIDGVTAGIDKLWYTDEEKAGDAQQAKREGMAVYMKWLESTSGSRIARRLLAVGAFSIWAVEHITAVIMRVLSNWFGDATVLVDGGFSLIGAALDRAPEGLDIQAAVVTTRSGVDGLRARRDVPFPVVNIPDGRLYDAVENRHGVGEDLC